jgi:cofilin
MAGSMSGVTVADDVVTEFNNIKLGHKYRYIQMKISDNKKVIEMEKTVEAAEYEEFVKQLPDKICRYAVFDFEYDLADSGQRQQLIFVVWCPDTAPVQMKMLYAASKDAVKKKLVGINHEVQATDHSELNKADILEKIKSKSYK